MRSHPPHLRVRPRKLRRAAARSRLEPGNPSIEPGNPSIEKNFCPRLARRLFRGAPLSVCCLLFAERRAGWCRRSASPLARASPSAMIPSRPSPRQPGFA
eukprot:576748-Prorocentrum_minimum.AAC.1